MSRIFIPVLGLVFLCAGAAWSGPAGAKKGEKKGHGVRGVVESVVKDQDKDTGYIVINVHHKKKGPAVEGDKDRKFKVTEGTKFVKLLVAKGEKPQREPASFKDVVKGEHVAIVPSDDNKEVARTVAIVVKTK